MLKLIRRGWKSFRTPSVKWAAGTLLVLGGVLSLASWAAFSAFVDHSSTLEFCTSCHEMRDFVFAEYKETIHYQNPKGVRAICADCHVPHALVPKLLRKFKATYTEIPAHLMGKIDTKEQFEAERANMAASEQARMKANDSAECRKCHSWDAMKLAEQRPRAKGQHEDAMKSGETCIDCHQGIAHHLAKKAEKPGEEKKEENFDL